MTSEEKMDLEAIDELAWFRIIDFLDYQSRLQCRLLSRTIKQYVDLSGLKLQPKWSRWFEDKDWKKFLENPDVRISKVHLSSEHWKSEGMKYLNFTIQHRVKYLYLEFCGSRSLETMLGLLKADWTRNIETLIIGSLALDLPKNCSPEGERIIEFPFLRKVYLIYKKQENIYGVRRKEYDILKMVNILLLKIRSSRMNLIFVELIDFGFGVPDPTLSLHRSLAEFVQWHAASLQTVIFKNDTSDSEESSSTESPETFRAIPYRLKHFDVDFFAFLDENSPWFKMLNNSLHHLESFTNKCNTIDYKSLNHTVHPELLSNLCRLNCKTLNYVGLTIRREELPLDLNTFSCCTSLHHLYLEIETREVPEVYLKNFTMLPVSLKCFKVERILVTNMDDPIPGEPPRIDIEFGNISNFCKFQNLVYLDAPTTFKNSEQLIHFIKVSLRLRKLDLFQLGDVNLIHQQEASESLQKRRLFLNALCERNLTEPLEPENHFEMQLKVSSDYRTITPGDHYNKTEKEYGPIYYEQLYGQANLTNKIEKELSLEYGGLESVEVCPPPVDHTRFQIGKTHHIY